MGRKQLPSDPHPDTEDRFNRLLHEMAKPVLQKQTEEDQTSDAARDDARSSVKRVAGRARAPG